MTYTRAWYVRPVSRRLTEAPEPQVLEAEEREGRADAAGADAILHPGGHAPLEQHEIGRRGHDAAYENRGFDEDF